MLDEIRSFFDRLRQPHPWPQDLSDLDSVLVSELRATWEKHSRLAAESVDVVEATLFEIYDAGAEDPAWIDFFDQVVSIIRRKGQSDRDRFAQLGELLREGRPR
jgi:hypothetical protein